VAHVKKNKKKSKIARVLIWYLYLKHHKQILDK